MFSRDPTSGLKVKALGFPFLLWDIQAFLLLLLSGTKTVPDGRAQICQLRLRSTHLTYIYTKSRQVEDSA